MRSMIAVQDEYIARVRGCQTGHLPRVRRAARKVAYARLRRLGFDDGFARIIVSEADDIVRLQAAAE